MVLHSPLLRTASIKGRGGLYGMWASLSSYGAATVPHLVHTSDGRPAYGAVVLGPHMALDLLVLEHVVTRGQVGRL